MSVFNYLILILSPLAGGMLALIFRTKYTRVLKHALVLGGGYLFVTCILHLIPETIGHDSSSGIKLMLIAGFFFQILLEKYTEGVDHGHLHLEGNAGHDHDHDHSHYAHQGLVISMGMLLSLSIHSVLEGIPLSGRFDFTNNGSNPLLVGIVLHKFPSAFALTTVLLQTRLKRTSIMLLLALFSIMNPLGAWIGERMVDSGLASLEESFRYLTAAAVGSFLHISTTTLYESSDHHKYSFSTLMATAAGAILAAVS